MMKVPSMGGNSRFGTGNGHGHMSAEPPIQPQRDGLRERGTCSEWCFECVSCTGGIGVL